MHLTIKLLISKLFYLRILDGILQFIIRNVFENTFENSD